MAAMKKMYQIKCYVISVDKRRIVIYHIYYLAIDIDDLCIMNSCNCALY